MTRNKLALMGLSALALVAMSAFISSGAQAEGGSVADFTCLEGGEPVHCTGDGVEAAAHHEERSDHHFDAGIVDVTCNKVKFDVLTEKTGVSATAPTTPTYEECEDTLSDEAATVTHNGCQYEFHVEEELSEPTDEFGFVGSADLVCDGEVKRIEIHTATGCLIDVPAQETIAPIYFGNMSGASPADVTVEAATAEVTSQYTGGFFKCLKSNGAHGIAKYTGNTTVQATNTDEEFIDAKVD